MLLCCKTKSILNILFVAKFIRKKINTGDCTLIGG